jgi:hypothetical protein
MTVNRAKDKTLAQEQITKDPRRSHIWKAIYEIMKEDSSLTITDAWIKYWRTFL